MKYVHCTSLINSTKCYFGNLLNITRAIMGKPATAQQQNAHTALLLSPSVSHCFLAFRRLSSCFSLSEKSSRVNKRQQLHESDVWVAKGRKVTSLATLSSIFGINNNNKNFTFCCIHLCSQLLTCAFSLSLSRNKQAPTNAWSCHVGAKGGNVTRQSQQQQQQQQQGQQQRLARHSFCCCLEVYIQICMNL